MKSRVPIIAHRGSSWEAPPNTLAAFHLAWAQHADAVEFDVRLSADHVPVLIHDATLLQTTGYDLAVHQLSLTQLQQYEVGSSHHKKWKGERIPTLKEALDILPPHKKFYIEIKDDITSVPLIKNILEEAIHAGKLSRDQLEVICFQKDVLRAARNTLPVDRCALLVAHLENGMEELIETCKENRFDALSLRYPLLLKENLIPRIHQAGLLCYTWTVNNVRNAQKLLDRGVDSITTDRPNLLLSALTSHV